MQSRREVPQNVIGIIWTYLQELMGGGVSYGSWRPEKAFFLGGLKSWGTGFGSSPSILGAQVGMRGPGVSAGVVVSVAYY